MTWSLMFGGGIERIGRGRESQNGSTSEITAVGANVWKEAFRAEATAAQAVDRRCAVAGRWRRPTKDVKGQVDKRQTYESAADAGQICERKDGDEEYGDKGKASQRKKKTSSDDDDETHKTRTRQEGEKGNCLKRRSPPDSQRTTPTIRGKAISHNDVGDGRGGKGKRSKQKMAMGSKVFKYLHQLRGGSQAMWLVRAVSLPAYVQQYMSTHHSTQEQKVGRYLGRTYKGPYAACGAKDIIILSF
ncbi:hypothetical protein EV127DRAFT_407583 [Xylaria flabelliformis]|nr:hypothetical protein EV127DRAFT_407583 [Xylaria flabelliformis]